MFNNALSASTSVFLFFANKDYYYETIPKKETISCVFIDLIENIQEYNMERTMLLWETGTQTNRHLYK